MSERAELIGRLIEQGYTPDQAIAAANKAYPKSGPRRLADSSADIVDAFVSPVATVAQGVSGAIETGFDAAFGWRRKR